TIPVWDEPFQAVQPTLAAPGAPEPTGPVVLLVEDDARSIELLTLYLTADNFRVSVARDGEAGLAMARRLLPAAIILDIRLPRLDGWNFLSQANTEPELASIPIVIVSVLDERGKGFAMGARGYIVKPARRDDL